MTAHASRLPNRFAPLIAEAKHRMRRRRSLVGLLIVVAGLALGLTFAFRSSSPGPDLPHGTASSLRVRDLTVSLPQGLKSYGLRGGAHMVGTRAPIIGHVLTDFRVPAHLDIQRVLGHWATAGPAANGVALKLESVDWMIGPVLTKSLRLHLPLTLDQPWFNEKLKDGAVGYRWGYLRFDNVDYQVMYWSGPNAPTADRAAVLRALESIRPAR